jgi:addiction module RelB/DinJ family antitoxin
MDTSVINIKVDASVKKQIQKIAQQMGISVSALINGFLRHVIKTKTVTFSASEEPTQFMLDALAESEKDIKEGRVVSFDNPTDAITYLDRFLINDAPRRKKTKKS